MEQNEQFLEEKIMVVILFFYQINTDGPVFGGSSSIMGFLCKSHSNISCTIVFIKLTFWLYAMALLLVFILEYNSGIILRSYYFFVSMVCIVETDVFNGMLQVFRLQ